MRCDVDQVTFEHRPGRPESFIWRVHFYDAQDLPMLGMGASLFAHDLAQDVRYAALIAPFRVRFEALARRLFVEWDEYLADGQGFELERVDVMHYTVGDRPGYGISVEALRAGDAFPGTLLLTHYTLGSAVTVNHKLIITDPVVADWVDTECRAILDEAAAVGLAICAGRSMTRRRATKLSQYMEPDRRLRGGS